MPDPISSEEALKRLGGPKPLSSADALAQLEASSTPPAAATDVLPVPEGMERPPVGRPEMQPREPRGYGFGAARGAGNEQLVFEPNLIDIIAGESTFPDPTQTDGPQARRFDPTQLPLGERLMFAGRQARDNAFEFLGLVDPASLWGQMTAPGAPLEQPQAHEALSRLQEGSQVIYEEAVGKTGEEFFGGLGMEKQNARLLTDAGALLSSVYGPKIVRRLSGETPAPPRAPSAPEAGSAPKARQVPLAPLESMSPVSEIKGTASPSKPPAPPTPPEAPTTGGGLGGTPRERILSRIIREQEKPKPSVFEKTREALNNIADYFEQPAPVARFERRAKGRLGEAGPTRTMEASQGKAAYDIERLWETGRLNTQEVTRAPPVERLREVYRRGDMDDLSAYALARREQSRYAPEGLDIGFSSDDAAAFIKQIEETKPHVKAAAESINDVYHALWDEAREVGAIPESTWKAGAEEFYVPVKRYFGPKTQTGGSVRPGRNMLQRAQVQRVKGGAQLIEEPIAPTFDRLVNLREVNNRARSGRKVMETFDAAPDIVDGMLEDVTGAEAKRFDFNALEEDAYARILSEDPGTPPAEARAMAREAAIKNLAEAYTGDYIVTHFPDGSQRVVRVGDKAFANALSAVGSKTAQALNHFATKTKFGKAMNLAAAWRRAGITMPLDFALRQMTLYDPINAFVNDPGSMATLPRRLLSGLKDAGVNLVNELNRRVMRDGKILPESEVARIFDDIGPMNFASLDRQARAGFTRPKAKGPIRGPVDILKRGAARVGNATMDTLRLTQEAEQSAFRRPAAYAILDDLKRKGEWTPGQPLTYDQVTMVTNAALRSGGSFRLGGKTSSAINRYIPFWKAMERPWSDAAYWFRKDPKKYLTRAAIATIVPHLVEWHELKDQEWYRDLPYYRRAGLNLGQDVWLPVYHPLALIGAGIKETLRSAYYGGNPEGAMVMARAIAEELPSWSGSMAEAGVEFADSGDPRRVAGALMSNVTPAGVEGLAELGAGMNFFTMRDINPIGSERLKREAPELVTGDHISPRVNALSKALFDASDGRITVTPLEIDHLARSYFGTIAKMATRSDVPEPEPADNPMFGWAHRRIKESQDVSDFYELLREYGGKQEAFRAYAERGNAPEMRRTMAPSLPPAFRRITEQIRRNSDAMATAPVEQKRELARQSKRLARIGAAILRGVMRKPPRVDVEAR